MSDSEIKLRRYLYLSAENPKYVAGKSKLNYDSTQTQIVLDIIGHMLEKQFIEIIKFVNEENLYAHHETLLFVLAVYTRCIGVHHLQPKNDVYDLILDVCKSTKEFFYFIKQAHALNKSFSHGLKRIVHQFYSKLEESDFTEVITSNKSYYGWSHKDVMKLVHFKPSKPFQDVLKIYTLKNLKEAKTKVTEEDLEELNIMLEKLDGLETLKKCNDEKIAVSLINKYSFNINQVPTQLWKSQIIWETLIPHFSILELLTRLKTLQKLGFLKVDTSTLDKTIEVLTDVNKCLECKIHPVEVFIQMKLFERPKPVDPQKRAFLKIHGIKSGNSFNNSNYKPKEDDCNNSHKHPAISKAFHKLLQYSYRNLYSSKQRILIAIDGRDKYKNRVCFQNKLISYFEAVSILVLSLLKSNKDVTIGVFKKTTFDIVEIEKGATMAQVLQQIETSNTDFITMSSAFQWALTKKKHIDVFINIVYLSDALLRLPKELKKTNKPMEIFMRYKNSVCLPNTKTIAIVLGNMNLSLVDDLPFVLAICGFDQNIHKLIEATSRGSLP